MRETGMTPEQRAELLASADNSFDRHEYEAALGQYRQILELSPDDIEAMTGLAMCCVWLDRRREAIVLLTEVRRHLPESMDLLYMLGDVYYKERRRKEATNCFQQVLTHEPHRADVHFQLGRIAKDENRPEEAYRHFKTAQELDPGFVDAYGLMGVLLSKHCRYAEAEAALKQACELCPEYLLGLNNLGSLYKMQGRLTEAYRCYRTALDIAPGNAPVVSNYLFALNNDPALSPEEIADEHMRLAPTIVMPLPNDAPSAYPTPGDTLKIGYISGDFYLHSVSYFLEPVLMEHDRKRFEIYCYSSCTFPDETTRRLQALPLVWREISGISTQDVAHMIRNDGIDVLIDLAGHTADNSLAVCAMRPAPVQATWLGYPATTGMSQIDYYITDAVCDPPGTEHLYSETLCRLPGVFSCYLPPMEFPEVSPPPYESNGLVTFCCFNSFAKVNEKLMGMWADILRQVPDSRLYLKSMPLGDQKTRNRIASFFSERGVESERLIMRTIATTPLEHLAEYAKGDIALDTFPYNGTTTTCEALWMGVPVISLAGSSHVSRVGLSFLSVLGLESLAALTPDDYVSKAVSLALDRKKISWFRNNLRSMMAHSPLMDAFSLTRNLENALVAMVEAAPDRNRQLQIDVTTQDN